MLTTLLFTGLWEALGMIALVVLLRGFRGIGRRTRLPSHTDEWYQAFGRWDTRASRADWTLIGVLIGLGVVAEVVARVCLVQWLTAPSWWQRPR